MRLVDLPMDSSGVIPISLDRQRNAIISDKSIPEKTPESI